MTELTADPVPSHRYAEAVRARRAELRAALAELTGAHRGELRTALALARLSGAAELRAELAQLTGWTTTYLDRGDRTDRRRLPALLLDAVDDLHGRMSRRRLATVRAAARRVARRRGVQIKPGWPPADEQQRPQWPPPPTATGSLWTGVAGGWRVALLPAAVLPAIGLRFVTGSPAVVLALGIVAAAVAGLHHAAVTDRARLRRWCDEVLAVAGSEGDAALARLLIHVEQTAGQDLDAGVARHRAELEAELAALVATQRPAATDA